MLTYNDLTVQNAIEVFEECKKAPAEYWGFKDTGIELEDMKELIKRIKAAGKITIFEVLSESEEECLRATRMALEFKLDLLIGMKFFDSVHKLVKNTPIGYFPTCGIRSGIPRMLSGSIEEIIDEAKKIEKAGVEGIALSAYRYTGNTEQLMKSFLQEIKISTIISGSINSYQRLDVIKRLRPWGFTVGSAFFNGDFGKDLTIREQIERVIKYLKAEENSY
jgi:hypothetical protein